MVSNRIAIIPARGGSKRIPRKNIIDFFGKPMIAWTIEAAKESQCFDEILVSTDDADIADVAKNYGASAPFLRNECADDYSPVSHATISSLKQAETHWDKSFGTVVQLMPNCPMRTASDIVNALNNFDIKNLNFQISCFKFGWMNPWWSVHLDKNQMPERLFPETASSRSQDLDNLYCPTGAIWIAQAARLKQESTFYGLGHVFQPMDWTSAVDIDDAEDLEMAKAVWILRNQKSQSKPQPT